MKYEIFNLNIRRNKLEKFGRYPDYIQIYLLTWQMYLSYEEQDNLEKAVTHPRFMILQVLANFQLITEKLSFKIFH